ncbi:MAG: NERD domain-containing protein [Candidatus Tectomicrobia bacterium]|nr:NERD domain-containing protein [Candidatus Tectomicrobia bacterium]
MAIIIPNLRLGHGKVTTGERRFASRLEHLLEDDYWCFYDVPVGKRRRYPDFIILHPRRGLLFLEVKDWKLQSILRIDHQTVELEFANGPQTRVNPVEQARQGAYQTIDMLRRDPDLRVKDGRFKGNLICPYGYGVVFPNITRKHIKRVAADDISERVLPGHLLICQDEMVEDTDPEVFQERLWGMFNHRFDRALTLPEVDRIRWHLYPEIRIDNLDLFPQPEGPESLSVPDIVRVMDIQQEQLARGLGAGHRVIHGVAGSGKTLILGYRSEVLAELLAKPILVLCFNITLAAKLRSHMTAKGITGKVHVYHFHDWCGEQLRTYHVDVISGDKPYWERQVDSVISGVEKEWIPREQYGALLIDEGHDFEEEWLRLVVQMIDRNTNSLLLLYDDGQAIYRRNSLGFSLSSVGVQARGRTRILKLNYRNTREILTFAYEFARDYLREKNSDDDHVPLVVPETAGVGGPKPIFRRLDSFEEETGFVAACVARWHDDGVPWRDVAIIYGAHWMGEAVAEKMRQRNVPCQLLDTPQRRKQYDPQGDRVVILTRQSSKGLEFPRVILMGLGELRTAPENVAEETRLLYVAMTRARECLLVTASQANVYTQKIESITAGEERQNGTLDSDASLSA